MNEEHAERIRDMAEERLGDAFDLTQRIREQLVDLELDQLVQVIREAQLLMNEMEYVKLDDLVCPICNKTLETLIEHLAIVEDRQENTVDHDRREVSRGVEEPVMANHLAWQTPCCGIKVALPDTWRTWKTF